MTIPSTRVAVVDDFDELDHLEVRARDGVRDQRGGIRLLERVAARSGRWADGAITIVVEFERLCVGYLVLIPGDVAVIEWVYVIDEAREIGCGDALIDAAFQHARSSGARRLEGLALPGDRETKNLYERAGITAKAIVVAIDLSDPSN